MNDLEDLQSKSPKEVQDKEERKKCEIEYTSHRAVENRIEADEMVVQVEIVREIRKRPHEGTILRYGLFYSE